MNDPFAREPTEQEAALTKNKATLIGALSFVIVASWLITFPAVAIIAWKAAL